MAKVNAFDAMFLVLLVSCVIKAHKGSSNTAADALSQNNLSLFYAIVPQASGCSVPPGVVNLLVACHDWTDLLTWQRVADSTLRSYAVGRKH